jgi:hypothetical protein
MNMALFVHHSGCRAMTIFRTRLFYLLLFWVFFLSHASWGAEPKVEIRTPKDGSRIAQEQNTILISGKVSTQEARRQAFLAGALASSDHPSEFEKFYLGR